MENDVLYNRIMNVVHEEYGPPGEGTTEITITENGTITEDVRSYASAEITTAVPNSYTESDEGKVVDNGALVSQSSATYTENDTYDTTLINSVTVNVSGSSIDFSDIKQAVALNNVGGLFTAIENGTWGSAEQSFASGTSPCTVNFGRAIKGLIFYPKNLTPLDGVLGEAAVISVSMWGDADVDGIQSVDWAINYNKGAQNDKVPCARPASGTPTVIDNGVFKYTPFYPDNAAYHAFRFNIPYIFVYWW